MAFRPGVQAGFSKKPSRRKQTITISKKGTRTVDIREKTPTAGGAGARLLEAGEAPPGQLIVEERVTEPQSDITTITTRFTSLPSRSTPKLPSVEKPSPVSMITPKPTAAEVRRRQSLPADIRGSRPEEIEQRVSKPRVSVSRESILQAAEFIEKTREAKEKGKVLKTTVEQPQKFALESGLLVEQPAVITQELVEPTGILGIERAKATREATRVTKKQEALKQKLRGVVTTRGFSLGVTEEGQPLVTEEVAVIEKRKGLAGDILAFAGEPVSRVLDLGQVLVSAQETVKGEAKAIFKQRVKEKGRLQAQAELAGGAFVIGAGAGLGASFIPPLISGAARAPIVKQIIQVSGTKGGQAITRLGLPAAFSVEELTTIAAPAVPRREKFRAAGGAATNIALFNLDVVGKAAKPIKKVSEVAPSIITGKSPISVKIVGGGKKQTVDFLVKDLRISPQQKAAVSRFQKELKKVQEAPDITELTTGERLAKFVEKRTPPKDPDIAGLAGVRETFKETTGVLEPERIRKAVKKGRGLADIALEEEKEIGLSAFRLLIEEKPTGIKAQRIIRAARKSAAQREREQGLLGFRSITGETAEEQRIASAKAAKKFFEQEVEKLPKIQQEEGLLGLRSLFEEKAPTRVVKKQKKGLSELFGEKKGTLRARRGASQELLLEPELAGGKGRVDIEKPPGKFREKTIDEFFPGILDVAATAKTRKAVRIGAPLIGLDTGLSPASIEARIGETSPLSIIKQKPGTALKPKAKEKIDIFQDIVGRQIPRQTTKAKERATTAAIVGIAGASFLLSTGEPKPPRTPPGGFDLPGGGAGRGRRGGRVAKEKREFQPSLVGLALGSRLGKPRKGKQKIARFTGLERRFVL